MPKQDKTTTTDKQSTAATQVPVQTGMLSWFITSCTGLSFSSTHRSSFGKFWAPYCADSSWTGLVYGSSASPPLPRDVWLTYTMITSPVKFMTCPVEMNVVLLFPVTWAAKKHKAHSGVSLVHRLKLMFVHRMFLDCKKESQSTRREHANPTQKGPRI